MSAILIDKEIISDIIEGDIVANYPDNDDEATDFKSNDPDRTTLYRVAKISMDKNSAQLKAVWPVVTKGKAEYSEEAPVDWLKTLTAIQWKDFDDMLDNKWWLER